MFGSDETPELPQELIAEIFSYLDIKDIPSIALVNKKFNSFVKSNPLFWQIQFKNKYPSLYENKAKETNVDWIQEFVKAYKDIKILKEFLDFKESCGNRYSNSLFANSKVAMAADTLKQILFFNADKTKLELFSRELEQEGLLGNIYAKLKAANLIDNAKIYIAELDLDGTKKAEKIIKKQKLK